MALWEKHLDWLARCQYTVTRWDICSVISKHTLNCLGSTVDKITSCLIKRRWNLIGYAAFLSESLSRNQGLKMRNDSSQFTSNVERSSNFLQLSPSVIVKREKGTPVHILPTAQPCYVPTDPQPHVLILLHLAVPQAPTLLTNPPPWCCTPGSTPPWNLCWAQGVRRNITRRRARGSVGSPGNPRSIQQVSGHMGGHSPGIGQGYDILGGIWVD